MKKNFKQLLSTLIATCAIGVMSTISVFAADSKLVDFLVNAGTGAIHFWTPEAKTNTYSDWDFKEVIGWVRDESAKITGLKRLDNQVGTVIIYSTSKGEKTAKLPASVIFPDTNFEPFTVFVPNKLITYKHANLSQKYGSVNNENVHVVGYSGNSAVVVYKLDGKNESKLAYVRRSDIDRLTNGGSSESRTNSTVSYRQQAVADYAISMIGNKNYSGYCQKFVREILERIGVTSNNGAASALDACNKWRVSTSREDIPVGACVYLRSKNTSGAGYKYGHVGIHVGKGQIVHAVSSVKKQSLDSMLNSYTYLGWGWQSGTDLR